MPIVAACSSQAAIPQSAAQLTVFDPANYQENLLSAARALEQINNQVRQLQNQVLMIQRMDQNLVRLGSTMSPDLQRTLADIQTQLRAGEGIALRLQATQSGYEQLFPQTGLRGDLGDDVLRNAKSRWDEEYAAFNAPRSCRARSPTASTPIRACSATPWPAPAMPSALSKLRKPATSSPP